MKLSALLIPLLLGSLAAPRLGWARPVSFLGGYTLMSENRFDQNEAMLAYTFHPKLSVGAHYNLIRTDGATDENYGMGMLNARLYRLNSDFWQANLYVSLGVGAQALPSQGPQARGAAVVEADAETRSFYSALRAEGWGYFGDTIRHYVRGRAGIAPYLSEANGLHAWTVLQMEYKTWRLSSVEITPLLRFAYQNLIFETGVSFTGRVQVNFLVEL